MANLHHFLGRFEVFRHKLPDGYSYCVEIRNPHWLRDAYCNYLADHSSEFFGNSSILNISDFQENITFKMAALKVYLEMEPFL